MKKFTRTILLFLGVIWASPITVLNLIFHVLPLWALRAYEFVGIRSLALVWVLRPKKKLPRHVKWVARLWKGWAGHAAGNVMVFRNDPSTWSSDRMLVHEMEHVKQVMRLGIFQPIMYALNYLAISVIDHADPYADNPFEIAARRGAGQPIDISMIRKRIEEQLKD